MSSFAFATRRFEPFALQPRTQRLVTATLGVAAGTLWLLVLPVELALALL
jgi:hypothetical protein